MTPARQIPEALLADWLNPGLQRLFAQFQQAGEELRFVGGCVRDALLGRPTGDLDLATTARPERTEQLIRDAGFRAVPTGLAHGTLTALLPEGQYEITSLRQDIACDGRHAVVTFGRDWAEDAARRDFTMNALYADQAGRIHDPVGGFADLAAGRLRFIGDPAARVAEDALRLLRYARFRAQLEMTTPVERELRLLFQASAERLSILSRERIRQEMWKLFSFPRAALELRWMRQCGWFPAIGLPEGGALWPLLRLARQPLPAPSPLEALACLLHGEDLPQLETRWALSRAEMRRLQQFLRAEPPLIPAKYPRHLALDGREAVLLALRREAVRRCDDGWLRDYPMLNIIPVPEFPLTATQLMQATGLPPGRELGDRLRSLRQQWLDANCQPDAEDLLARPA